MDLKQITNGPYFFVYGAATSPILSINIFNATTFTAYGLELIGLHHRCRLVVDRNVRTPTKASFDI